MRVHLCTLDTFLVNKETKNNEKYKALCLQGQLLLNRETKKLNFVFSPVSDFQQKLKKNNEKKGPLPTRPITLKP